MKTVSAADANRRFSSVLREVTAAENRCRLLLTEDLQAGFTWRGLTVVNPFAQPHPSLLVDLLGKRKEVIERL